MLLYIITIYILLNKQMIKIKLKPLDFTLTITFYLT